MSNYIYNFCMQKKVKILIDSSSTFDKKYLDQNNISVVPLSLSDNVDKVYTDDGVSINPEILFNEIEKGNKFKTSCTPLGQLMMAVENALEDNDIVFFIPISHGLSSQYNQAKILEEDYPGRFFVINSTSAAYANEYVCTKLVQLVKELDDPKEIVSKCEQLYLNTDTYFSCEDVSDLLKGGRVTQGIIKVVKLLKLKPIILLDTKNQKAGMSRNYRDNAQKMIKLINEDYENKLQTSDIESIAVYYSGYEEEKKNFLLDTFAKAFNFLKEKIVIRWVPTVVLAHTRKGAYGITICTKTPHKLREIKVD